MASDKYILGFNHAYILQDKNHKVLSGLVYIKSESDYILGLKDGTIQFYKDMLKNEIKKSKNKVEEEYKKK